MDRLVLAGLAGAGASFVGWLIALQLFFLIWIMSILVGFGVGEIASRIAKQRVSRTLEIIVGGDIVLGFVAVAALHSATPGFGYHPFDRGFAAVTIALNDPLSVIMLILAIAAAVMKLRH